jgi:hypothetical protein
MHAAGSVSGQGEGLLGLVCFVLTTCVPGAHMAHRPARAFASVAFVLSAATLLGACSDGEPTSDMAVRSAAAPDHAQATAPASPSAPPEPSVEDAAQAYLEIVRPYNEALEGWENAINGGQPLENVTAAAAQAATALDAEAAALRDTPWPAQVASHAEQLAAASEQAATVWREMAAAESFDGVQAALDSLQAIDDNTPATAIRELLQLDRYDEAEYQGSDG